MGKVTGGELVVRALRKAGVEKLFALHGAHVDSIFQGCLDHDVPIVDVRHEVNAGHAAEGYARVTRGLGVALVTAGGGMTNVVTSIANAYLDRTPVLYLCGSGALNQRQTNTLQADIDQVALASPITKWAYEVSCIDHIPRIIAQAVRIAMQAPRGPVMLELPWDILMGEVDPEALPEAGVTTLHAAGANDADISHILDVMAGAKRPVIVVGTEANRTDTTDAVARLSAATGAPVFAEYEGVGVLRKLPDGLFGGLVQLLFGLGDQAPDVVLIAGTRFGFFTGHGTGNLIPRSARILQIDPDAREIGRLQPIDFGVVAEVGLTLESLAKAAAETKFPDRTAWQQTLRAHTKRRDEIVTSQIQKRPGVLHPYEASKIVAEYINSDITVVADGALSYLWLSETVAEPRPAGLLCHSHLTSMGFGFGVAVGAQAGVAPGKRVILVTGDGSVGYSLGEFDAAVRAHLPLIVIVMNNRSWGATMHFQQMVAGGDNRITGTRLENGRYDRVAEGLGATGYRADSAESLREALRTALSKNEAACIDVLVDISPLPPEELVMMGMDPFAPTAEQVRGA